MSGMLLCQTHTVQTPYFVEELGIHLYSGEELSYYIYHNAMIISDDFMGEGLYRFIGQELGLENLEGKLRKWEKSADLSELLLVILQDIHYYNGEELEAFRKQLERLGRLTPAQRMRKKAEYLLKNRRYDGAILQYDRLLDASYGELRDKEFLSGLWKGRGIAFARQYRFAEAAESLEKAERLWPNSENLRMLYQIQCIDPAIQPSPELMNKVSDSMKRSWEVGLRKAKDQARFQGKGKEAEEWMDRDNIRRASGLSALTERWKMEYRRNQDL